MLSGAHHPDSLLRQFQALEKTYKLYAQTAKETCQGVWAKFDLKLIITGILIILSGVFVALFFAVAWKGYENTFSFPSMLLTGGSLLLIVYVLAHTLLLSESAPPLMAFILSLAIIFAAFVCVKRGLSKAPKLLTQDNVFSSSLVMMHCSTFFSNSYIVHDDMIAFFFLQSVVLYYCLKIVYFYVNSQKRSNVAQKVVRKQKPSKFDVMQFIANPVTTVGLVAVSVCVILRSAHLFCVCREEKSDCEDSFFSLPLSAVDKGYINQRYAFSLVCLAVMVFMVRQWLKYYGNMTGSDAGVITMRYAPPVAAVCVGLYWALQAVPESALEALTPWQQAALAQVVYVAVILALAVIVLWPLLVYNHPTSMSPTAAILNKSGDISMPIYQ